MVNYQLFCNFAARNKKSEGMKLSLTKHPVVALVANLALVYVLFMLCRLVFVAVNWGLYADTMTWSHLGSLCTAGLIFDTSAIL